VAGALVLPDVRESGRGLLAVTDDDALLRAMRELASRGGVVAEPAGAAAFAGLNVALDRRLIDRDEEVVVLVTGSALKTPQFLGGRRRGDRDRGLPGGG
jgi:threonine synthase